MIVSSTAFENNGIIPQKHTGFGEDISPELTITDVPEKSRKKELLDTMSGRILAEAKFIGRYKRD